MNKRSKAILLSIILGIAFLPSWRLKIENPSLAAIFVASIIYFGLYWVLEFNIIGLRLFFIFLLPIMFDFMFIQSTLSLGSRFLMNVEGVELFIAIIFGILNYIIILTANILNVSSVRKIPLLQVAQTSLYFFSVFLFFLVFDSIQRIELSPVIDIFLIFTLSFLILYQLFWFIIEDKKLLFFTVLSADFALILVYIVLSFWPIHPILFNILMTAVVYVLSGLVMHSIKKSLTRGTELEYAIIILVLLITVIVTSNWNSFGSIFD